MNTDKNTIIGFVLLAGLFFMYFWYTNKQQTDLATYKKHFDDSVAMVKATAAKAAALQIPAKLDAAAGLVVNNIDTVKEEFTYLENEVVKVKFSNKGGQVAEVTLKNYTNYKKDFELSYQYWR
jgi:YidC/Oxa1 family membrane protein insertase